MPRTNRLFLSRKLLLLLFLIVSATTAAAQRRGKIGPEYQYNGARYHPVEEYLVSSVEKLTSDTPAFVLEVTWPRVALFYHPVSPLCIALRDKYVAVAREIRRRSIRVPVEFWAVSCQIHRDACEELGVTAVPRLLAFPAGKIEGKIIPRTEDNSINIETIIHALGGVSLKHDDNEEEEEAKAAKEFDEQQQHHKTHEYGQKEEKDADEMSHDQSDRDGRQHHHHHHHHYDKANKINNHDGSNIQHDQYHEILHPHSGLPDVTADAMTSLLHAIDQAVIQDSGEAIPWSYDKVRVFREWLDLLHWSLPTRDMAMVHNIINDLRNNIGAIEDNPGEITKILKRHDYYRHKHQWTDSCRPASQQRQQQREREGREDKGYKCGFWKLLHVIAIGVDQQHEHVLGDLNRIVVPHVLQVIRDYVRDFGFAGSNNNNNEGAHELVRAYDDCMDKDKCRYEMGFEKRRGFFQPFRRTIPSKTDPVWRNLALWIWQRHQAYRNKRRGGSSTKSNGNGFEELQWPAADLCPKCYSSRGLPDDGGNDEDVDDLVIVDRINSVMWNKGPVYEHLKHEYWPRSLQSPRVVVLDRWDRGKVAKFLNNKGESKMPWIVVINIYFFVGLGIMYMVGTYEKHRRKERRKQRRRRSMEEEEISHCDADSWKQTAVERGSHIHHRRRSPTNSYGPVSSFRPFLDD